MGRRDAQSRVIVLVLAAFVSWCGRIRQTTSAGRTMQPEAQGPLVPETANNQLFSKM